SRGVGDRPRVPRGRRGLRRIRPAGVHRPHRLRDRHRGMVSGLRPVRRFVAGRLGACARIPTRVHWWVARQMAHLAMAAASVALIGAVLWDAFETVILPRSIVRRFRLASAWVRALWFQWRLVAARTRPARRERFLAIFGPIALLSLIA